MAQRRPYQNGFRFSEMARFLNRDEAPKVWGVAVTALRRLAGVVEGRLSTCRPRSAAPVQAGVRVGMREILGRRR